MSTAPLMDIAEFRSIGLLEEVNRRVLHPLGLALAVTVEDDGTETLYGIYDSREDPEGWVMGYASFPGPNEARAQAIERAHRFDEEWERRRPAREAALGFMIQPPGVDAA